jgi:hypothetical protein
MVVDVQIPHRRESGRNSTATAAGRDLIIMLTCETVFYIVKLHYETAVIPTPRIAASNVVDVKTSLHVAQ